VVVVDEPVDVEDEEDVPVAVIEGEDVLVDDPVDE